MCQTLETRLLSRTFKSQKIIFLAKERLSEQSKETHTQHTYTHVFSHWQVQKENETDLENKTSQMTFINQEENLTYLVTARVQMVTKKQPATIIQPQPPSGGEVDRALVTFAMVSTPLSSFPGYSNCPVMMLEEVFCPVTSCWHSSLA